MKEENAAKFEGWIQEAIALLPQYFRKRLANVTILIDHSYPNDIRDFKLPSRPDLILGLYRGIPYPKRHLYQPYKLPDTIIIYADNIERLASNEKDMREFVIDTVLHELGHYFGLSEGELRQISRDRAGTRRP